MNPIVAGRIYLAVQAAAGTLWWIAVFISDDVRRLTLGTWNPDLLVGPDMLLFVGCSAIAAATAGRWWGFVVASWTVAVTLALAIQALVERTAGWGAVSMTLASIFTLSAALTLWFGRLPTQWFFLGPFRFRESKPNGRLSHLARSLIQLTIFWSALLIALPLALGWIERRLRMDWAAIQTPTMTLIGTVVFAGASALGLRSCFTMALLGKGTPLPSDTAAKLVVAGPYRFVRNPMAVAGAIQTIGVGLSIGSWMVIASAFAGAFLWNRIIRPEEEADLALRFGADYLRYAQAVACWIPQRR